MSDIHIYLEREQPVKVITLEPTGARGPVGPQGPAGAAGPNSVTSATTSDGTAELSLESVSIGSGTTTATLDVTQLQIINDINEAVVTSGGVVVASYLESGTSQASLTADSIQIGATGGGSVNIYATGSADFSGEVTAANLTVTPSGSLILTSTNSGGFVSINGEAATDARTVAFPDASGTVALFDGSGNLTVSGVLYANHIHGNLAGSVYAHVRAGEALLKGDPVYISGSHGSGSTLIPIVSKADASNSAKMPAIGIMDADLANNANGHMVITGTIADLNTAAYAVNDTLYVASGGGLTATPPTANSQPVARVERSNANNGALIVKVNGLASNGGNGASDANKLVRFSSTGTIPVASIGGLGTGVATALAVNTGSAGAFVVNGETATNMTFAGTATFTGQTEMSNQSASTLASALTVAARSNPDLIYIEDDFIGGQGTMSTSPQNSPFGFVQVVMQGSSSARYGRHIQLSVPTIGSLVLTTGANRRDAVGVHIPATVGGTGNFFQNNFNTTAFWAIRFKMQTTTCGFRLGFSTPLVAGGMNPNRFMGLDATTPFSAWQASTSIAVGEYREPTVANGRKYYASVAGTTGLTEPTWPTTAAGTVVDGGVTWVEDGRRGFTNFQYIARDNANQLTGVIADSGIVVDTNWHVLRMSYKGGTTWGMSLDGGAETNITSPIGGTIQPCMIGMTFVAASSDIILDYVRFFQFGRP